MAMQLSRAASAVPVEARLLIGGAWVDGPAHAEVRNPAHPDEIVGTIVRGTPSDVNLAVAAAKAAQPAWAAHGVRERAKAIAKGLEALAEDVDERAILYVRENGKTLAEARGEVASLPDRLRVGFEYVDALAEPRLMDAPTGRTFVSYRPYGVVVSIVPWNAPVNLAFAQVFSALLAGNAVVVKPPETAPLAVIASLKLFARDLPPGVVNVVTGLPDEIGDTLTTHPDVGKIVFTGSIRSARHIGSNAMQTIKSMLLELGGNDPAIVLEDVDLGEKTMDRMAGMVYGLTGQVCGAIKRIYVPESIAGPFAAAFRRAAQKIVVGDGLQPGVTMGPLHTQAGLTRATGYVDDARARGATVDLVGTIADRAVFERGYFMQPSIVTDIAADAPLVLEEQFCPSVPIVTYRDLDEAFTHANETVYGLCGSVWGGNLERALALANRIDSGTIWVNTHGMVNRRAPFGGVKQSGIGVRGGLDGVLEYVQPQTVTTFEQS
jgi:acyl-CoA reductase-like NAD-dependent aldehyde dehydrogenase